jgi:NADPH2:quinone reductase
VTEGQHLVVDAWGETPLDTLAQHVRLAQQPRPEELAPNEVLLRVRSAAVGWVDLLMLSGQYQHMAPPPYTPGLEFAGEVEAVGASVARVRPGDAVLADGFLTGPRSSGAWQRWGGFATWAVLPEEAAIPLPAPLGYDEAVNLLGNWETAYHVLVHRAGLQPGQTVVVLGASGSTGVAAVQLAALLGARAIAVGRTAEKLAPLRELGATGVIATSQLGDAALRDAVRDLNDGRDADVVWDGVGGELSLDALRCLRFGGRFCIVGWAGTPFVAKGRGERGAPNANQLPTNLIQMKGLDVLGCPAVIATRHDPALRPARLRWVLDHVADGSIRPFVGPAYLIARWREALEAKWESRHLGGCVLHP